MSGFFNISLFVFLFVTAQVLGGGIKGAADDSRMTLQKWLIKSTILEKNSGSEISKGKVGSDGWITAEVPTTVLNALVKNGTYPDPRIDINNYLIPDISDKFNQEHNLARFSYLPNKENPWKAPYWFITKFQLPETAANKQIWLNFDGINYRAEVWINGVLVADSAEMFGMFQRFKFNITKSVHAGQINHLAVKIFPVDHPGNPKSQLEVFGPTRGPVEEMFKDLTLKVSGGWDCALTVRDRNMGIYQDVYLTYTDDVDILHPFVRTDLKLPDTSTAYLTVSAVLANSSAQKVSGKLKGTIELLTKIDMGDYVKELPVKMKTVEFEKEVELPANDTMTVTLSPNELRALEISNPYLWWPNGYGEQYLHNLKLTFVENGKVSAEKNTLFGIRTITSDLKELRGEHGRVFRVNGKKIYCRGGWLQPDMLLDFNKEKIYNEARLMARANINTVGTEDMPSPVNDYVEACDKYGLMWWEVFYQCYVAVPGTNTAYFPLDHYQAIKATEDIILRYRNSPSLAAWAAANEAVPGPDLFFALKEQLTRLDKERTFIASTALWWDWKTLSPYVKDDLPTGTTDNGEPDYKWYPVPYYFDKVLEVKDQMFRNELGIASIPVLSSLKKSIFNLGANKNLPFYPLDSVWAEQGAWDYPGYAFKEYDNAIRNVYGFNTKSVSDYVRIAQILNTDNHKAMIEAYNARLWDIVSGIMIWKINSASPMVLWQLYDWFLNPNASYYAFKKACEPIHVQLNGSTYQVTVINSTLKPVQGLKLRARIIDMNLSTVWERKADLDIDANCYKDILNVPKMTQLQPVYFVKLELTDNSGNIVSENLYWESAKSPADFSAVSNLERVKADLTYSVSEKANEFVAVVKIKNTTGKLSFMNRLVVLNKSTNEEILPTFWDDNYVTLFPGEERSVKVSFDKKYAGGSSFVIAIDNE